MTGPTPPTEGKRGGCSPSESLRCVLPVAYADAACHTQEVVRSLQVGAPADATQRVDAFAGPSRTGAKTPIASCDSRTANGLPSHDLDQRLRSLQQPGAEVKPARFTARRTSVTTQLCATSSAIPGHPRSTVPHGADVERPGPVASGSPPGGSITSATPFRNTPPGIIACENDAAALTPAGRRCARAREFQLWERSHCPCGAGARRTVW